MIAVFHLGDYVETCPTFNAWQSLSATNFGNGANRYPPFIQTTGIVMQ